MEPSRAAGRLVEPVVNRLLRALFRRGTVVAMEVRADEVRVGDRVTPKDAPVPVGRLPVVEITRYESNRGRVPGVYLMILARGGRFTSIYLPDELVSIERRIR